MPIDASIPLGVKTPDTFSTLGSIANLAKGVTDLQRSKVALEQDTGALKARRAVAQVLADPQNHNEDGTINLDKFSIAAYNADPDNYVASDFLSKAASSNHQLVTLKAAALGLGDKVQEYVGQRLGALALDPAASKADFVRTLDDAVRIAGPGSDQAKKMREISLERIKNLPDEPAAVAKAAAGLRNGAFTVAQQAPQTAFVGTGAVTQPVQSNPLGGPVAPNAPPIANQVGPANAEQIVPDLAGNPMKVITAPDGRKSYAPIEGSRQPPLVAFPPGESQQSAADLSKVRSDVNLAARNIGEQHFNNTQIIKLADNALTGTASDKLNAVLSSVGLQKITGDKATDYATLGHYIARNSMANATAMGAGTDAARDLASQANVSRNWTPDAIKKAARVNDALATGLEMFNMGMERAINDPSNQKSIFAVRDFQNEWAKNFDVNAVRLFSAVKSGDKTEQAAIVKDLGGAGSEKARAVAEKYRTMKRLVMGNE